MIVLEKPVFFYAESEEPIRLEGVLHLPGSPGIEAPLAILCHPHPIAGGCMDVPLLLVLARRLAASGVATLRFNFRGVGRSSGISTGGVRETEDIQGIMRWIGEQEDLRVKDIFLAGWSFGSWVGLRWALASGVPSRIALISPPTVGFDFFYFLKESRVGSDSKILILHGEHDQFVDERKVEELVQGLGAERKILSGADHFLFGREEEVASAVRDFFA